MKIKDNDIKKIREKIKRIVKYHRIWLWELHRKTGNDINKPNAKNYL